MTALPPLPAPPSPSTSTTLAAAFNRYEAAESLFILALGLHACSVVGYSVGSQDLARKSASLISGCTVGVGIMSGAAAQSLTGAALDANGRDFVPVFVAAAAVQVVGAALFARWYSAERIFE